MLSVYSDEHYMKQAFLEAEKAFEKNEVPVGAVVVCNQQIIARAHNLTEQLNDVTAHAEILAFTAASEYLGSKYLKDCTLYVTLEPCLMCAGASYWSQIDRIVYGASDEKRGFQRLSESVIHPKTTVKNGIMSVESEGLLKRFFQNKRKI